MQEVSFTKAVHVFTLRAVMGPNRCAKLRSIVEVTLYRYVLLSNLKNLFFSRNLLYHSNVGKLNELNHKLLRQVYVRSQESEKILGLSKKSFIFFRFRNWCLKTFQDAPFFVTWRETCKNSRVQEHFMRALRKSPSRKLIDSLLPLTPWQTRHPRLDRDLVAMIEARKVTV